ARPHLSAERVLILYGDVPLIEAATLQRLREQANDRPLGLLTVELPAPTGHGRTLPDEHGAARPSVEHQDASEVERALRERDPGILAVPGHCLGDWLGRLSNRNAQREYCLTDVIAMAVGDGLRVAAVQGADEREVLGANDRIQLAQLERHYQARAARRL